MGMVAGGGGRGQEAAELEAKDGFGIYKPVQEHVGKRFWDLTQ